MLTGWHDEAVTAFAVLAAWLVRLLRDRGPVLQMAVTAVTGR